jgi:hypothetical protein
MLEKRPTVLRASRENAELAGRPVDCLGEIVELIRPEVTPRAGKALGRYDPDVADAGRVTVIAKRKEAEPAYRKSQQLAPGIWWRIGNRCDSVLSAPSRVDRRHPRPNRVHNL